VHQHELTRGHRNRATLQVARKLVAYLMAVDKSGQPFQMRSSPQKLECKATGKKERKKMPDPALAPA